MTDFDFLLSDRLQKIKAMNEIYNLDKNAYISFSGGKDSTVLSVLFDMAFNNSIPRVYIDTGIDYKAITDFVRECKVKDNRIQIIKPSQNIRQVLESFGYPFKSKEHSQKVALYQKSGMTKTVVNYLGGGIRNLFYAPKNLDTIFHNLLL